MDAALRSGRSKRGSMCIAQGEATLNFFCLGSQKQCGYAWRSAHTPLAVLYLLLQFIAKGSTRPQGGRWKVVMQRSYLVTGVFSQAVVVPAGCGRASVKKGRYDLICHPRRSKSLIHGPNSKGRSLNRFEKCLGST